MTSVNKEERGPSRPSGKDKSAGSISPSDAESTVPTKPIMSVLGELQKYATLSQEGHDEFKTCQWQLTKSRCVGAGAGGGVVMTENTSYQARLVREELRARYRLFSPRRRHEKQQHHDDNDPGELLDELSIVTTGITSATKEPNNLRSAPSSSTKSPQKEVVSFSSTIAATTWQLKDIVLQRREAYYEKQQQAGTEETPSASGLHQRKTATTVSTSIEDEKEDGQGDSKSSGVESTKNTSPVGRSSDEDERSWMIIREEDTAGYVENYNGNDDIDERYLYLDDDEKLLLKKNPIELFGAGGGGSLKSSRSLKVAATNARSSIEKYVEAANHAAKILQLLQREEEQQHKITL